MNANQARIIGGKLARRQSLGIEEIQEPLRNEWRCCVCKQQTTRRKVRKGKEIVLCSRCDQYREKKR